MLEYWQIENLQHYILDDAPFGEPVLIRQLIEYVSPSNEITKMVLGDNIQNLLEINKKAYILQLGLIINLNNV